MAELGRVAEDLVLRLTPVEKAESLHGDIRVPITSVSEVEIVEDIIHQAHGVRRPGAGMPGRFMIGTLARATQKKSFAVVLHETPRGVRVRLNDEAFGELLVDCVDPEAVAASVKNGGWVI